MINSELRNEIKNQGFENSLLFENPSFDGSIIGVTTWGGVIYDYNKMVDEYMNENKCSYEDADDFISYNTIRSLDYITEPAKPVIMFSIL